MGETAAVLCSRRSWLRTSLEKCGSLPPPRPLLQMHNCRRHLSFRSHPVPPFKTKAGALFSFQSYREGKLVGTNKLKFTLLAAAGWLFLPFPWTHLPSTRTGPKVVDHSSDLGMILPAPMPYFAQWSGGCKNGWVDLAGDRSQASRGGRAPAPPALCAPEQLTCCSAREKCSVQRAAG